MHSGNILKGVLECSAKIASPKNGGMLATSIRKLKDFECCVSFMQKRWAFEQIKQDPEKDAAMPIFQYFTEKRKWKDSVWVWGCAQYGALGMKSYVKPEPRKRRLVSQGKPSSLYFARKNKVTDVACGYGFTLLTVKPEDDHDYQVFGTGINSDSQIGYHTARKDHPLEIVIEPAPIQLPLASPKTTKVKKIACGRAHSLVLTDNEGIFSLGNNAYGQCGRPVVENENYKGNPRIEKVHLDKKIEQIICGQDNSIFITPDGEVYCAGWGADGQLGTGSFKNVWQPSKVNGDIQGEKIEQVSCAADCVLALSDNGSLFGWGNSEYGQLAKVTDSQQLSTPRHIPMKGYGKIVQIAAAGTMCAILNSEGHVFVWGFGVLGKGPELVQSDEPSLIPPVLFGRNDFSPDMKVVKITCGLNHFAAITDNSDLYTWGKNKMNCLGLGKDLDQFFPLRVSLAARAFKVSCGVDHTAALCKPIF